MSGSNRLAGLKAQPKDTTLAEVRRVDEVGEARGLVDRSPRKKPGRKPSPRTHQLHSKVFSEIGEVIAAEAERLGITQGQLIGMRRPCPIDFCGFTTLTERRVSF